MKKKRSIKLLLFAALVCCLVVLGRMAWRAFRLRGAKPSIKVDYLAEYNRITKPAGYDRQKDAAPHYVKLFSEFTPMPEVLSTKFKPWPGDFSPAEFKVLDEWAAANKSAAGVLRTAAEQPYCWFEMTSSDGSLWGIQMPYSQERLHCTLGVVLLAKYKAYQGNIDGGLQLLADLYTMGLHYSSSDTLLEQLMGLPICRWSSEATIDVLSRCSVKIDVLTRTRERFSLLSTQLDVPRFTRGEFLFALDCIQRAFTDDGSQNGILIPRELHSIMKDGGLFAKPLSDSEAFWVAFRHPTRKKTIDRYEAFFELAPKVAARTPWDMYASSTSYEEQMASSLKGYYFLNLGVRGMATVIDLGWCTKTQDRATETILAILAYKADRSRLPRSLDDVVAKSYLMKVPSDPYSDGPLGYRVLDEDFTLYSVGANFSDDGGVARSWAQTKHGGDIVFWPVTREPEEE